LAASSRSFAFSSAGRRPIPKQLSLGVIAIFGFILALDADLEREHQH
jgi:hypothetical protein